MTVMFTLLRKKKTKQTESVRAGLCTTLIRVNWQKMEMGEYLYPTGHFTVVYLVAKSLIWSKAESNLVVVETSV